jgi:hypothetical protein
MRPPETVARALFFVALAAAPGTAADQLMWPTDAGRCVTSSFCEFRPGHFHSGIDISTRGRTGFEIYAVGDGDLVRARVSCGGYGRAVYLRLEDGRTAVYAHLSRFEGAIARSVRTYQEWKGTSYVDLDLTEGIPVKAGDVIGYTGQSGTGVPHLHFEMRDETQRPLDPFTEGFAIADTSPPLVTRIALTPLTFVSSVDGRSDTVILDVHGDTAAEGRIPRTIPVEGEIGIAIEVDESTDVCRFRLAPHRMILQEGDETLYEVSYSGFDFSETGAMDLQIDPRFSYAKVGRFHNLWRRPGNELPFSPGEWKADGVLRARQLPPEERPAILPDSLRDVASVSEFPWLDSVQRSGERVRSLTIVAEDAAGNRGTVDLNLSFAAPPSISVMSVGLVRRDAALGGAEAELEGAWPDSVEVHGAFREGGRPIRHIAFDYSLDAGRTWHFAPPVVPELDHSFHARFRVTQRVPGEGERDVLVRARAVDELGAAGIARTTAPETSEPPRAVQSPALHVATLGPWFEVRFSEAMGWNALSGGWDDDKAVLVRPWGRGVRIVLPAAQAGIREWSGRDSEWKGYDAWGRPVPLRFQVPVHVVPEAPAAVSDGAATFRFPSGVFAESTWVRVRREPAPRAQGELRPLSEIRFLETGQVPTTRSFAVELWPDESVEHNADRLGIFVQEPAGFRYLGGDAGEGGGRVVETRTPLGIGLFEDVTAPVLGEPRLEDRHGRVRLTFLAEDDGCGIDCADVEVLFEGRSLLYELDDETGEVIAYPRLLAESGAGGRFEMRAVDRCGNSAKRVETVRLP